VNDHDRYFLVSLAIAGVAAMVALVAALATNPAGWDEAPPRPAPQTVIDGGNFEP
jgi:hypothetical protein